MTSLAPLPAPGLELPAKRFANRELSWLDFNERVLELASRQSALWNGDLKAALAEQGIVVATPESLSARELRALTKQFEREILPVLTPLAVGAASPFPYIPSLALNLGVFARDE